MDNPLGGLTMGMGKCEICSKYTWVIERSGSRPSMVPPFNTPASPIKLCKECSKESDELAEAHTRAK